MAFFTCLLILVVTFIVIKPLYTTKQTKYIAYSNNGIEYHGTAYHAGRWDEDKAIEQIGQEMRDHGHIIYRIELVS